MPRQQVHHLSSGGCNDSGDVIPAGTLPAVLHRANEVRVFALWHLAPATCIPFGRYLTPCADRRGAQATVARTIEYAEEGLGLVDEVGATFQIIIGAFQVGPAEPQEWFSVAGRGLV